MTVGWSWRIGVNGNGNNGNDRKHWPSRRCAVSSLVSALILLIAADVRRPTLRIRLDCTVDLRQ